MKKLSIKKLFNKKRLPLLLAAAALIVTTVVIILALQGGDNVDGGGETPAPEEKLVWNFDADVYLITETDGKWKIDFADTFFSGTDGITLIGSKDKFEKREHEIVIGSSTREVSRLAYEALQRGLADDDDAEGYLVYVHDGSLAIAYSSEATMKPSIAAFLENCLTPELRAADGIILSDFYSLRARAEENRQKMYDEQLATMKEELIKRGADNADGIVDGIRKLYSLYETDQLIWLANLYDVEDGGFYYSNSGRDNLGFLPDLESTAQALSNLDRSGLFDDFGGLKTLGVPEAMRESMLNWLLGLQSSEDGFFYHPQWGTKISSSRRGRDLDNARSLFSYLKAKPYYDEPSGNLEGTLGAPGVNAVKPMAYLASPLGGNLDFSAVRPVASTLPYYLQSIEAWAEYLEVKNVSRDSYSVGNTLASDWSLIKAAGPEYVEYVINHLNERQIPETGLWEYNTPDDDYDPTDGIGYNGTNGLMKICVLYGSLGYSVPNAYNALQSAIKVGCYPNTDPKDETVCYVLNIWTCLNSMMSNVKKNDPNNYPAARALLIEKAPELLEASYDLLKTHLMPDGGFSYYERQPINISQGALVGYAEQQESDVNATMVATSSTIGAMFGALELAGMNIWCPDDYYIFMDAYEALEPIVKQPKNGVETFENYGEDSIVNIDLSGSDAYAIVTHGGSLNGGKTLKINSEGGSFGRIGVDVRNKDVHTYNLCYFIDSDFLVNTASVGELMRYSLCDDAGAPLMAITLECYEAEGKKYLRFVETFDGLDGERSEIVSGLTLGEWHRLRIVTNKVTRNVDGENKLFVYNKVMLDDRYITTVDSSVTEGGYVVDRTPSYVDIKLSFIGETEIYLDNLHSERTEVPYT